jgi:DNA-binding beta-propeller fold protein YncE
MKWVRIISTPSLMLFICLVFFSARAQEPQWELDTVISAGTSPSGIAITSDGSKLVVTNYTDPGAVKIISTSDYILSDIDISSVENYPNGVTIAPNDSIALVNTTHNVIFIDLFGDSIRGNFTAPCASTTLYGVAVTPDGQDAVFPDLSSGCIQQGLRLIDATGQTSGSSFIQVTTSGVLYGIAIAPDGPSAIVSTFTSDSPKKVNLLNSNIQNITGISGSYGLAILHSGNEALIFDGDSLDRVSLISNSVTKKISYLSYNISFQNIAVTADDKYAFVIGAFEKLVISLANDSIIQTFSAGGTNVATTSDGSKFFVTDNYNGTVRVYKKQESGVEDNHDPASLTFALQQNFPNPFSSSTDISFTLPSKTFVSLKVFDPLGKEVTILVNEELPQGTHLYRWNAGGIPGGVYFYRLQTDKYDETKKLILLR